jgi:AhpD family alkylhydroperoxidase
VSAPTPPRIAPGGRRQIGTFAWIVAAVSGRVSGTAPPNLLLTLGRNRRLFLGWLHFAGRLMPGGKLPRRETELVILRVAHVRDCRYEHDHHVKLGRRAGLSDPEIARVVDGSAAQGWAPREQAVLEATDELLAQGDITDETWARVSGLLDKRELIELVMLVGHYEMLAKTINTLRIQPDE